jgi:U1 small nuclear ribonucleoprotein C
VRKAHNSGRNHLSNVRDYYACTHAMPFHVVQVLTVAFPALGHDKAQTIIDQITQAFERGGGPPPGGFNFQFPAQPVPFGQPGFAGPPPGFRKYSRIS